MAAFLLIAGVGSALMAACFVPGQTVGDSNPQCHDDLWLTRVLGGGKCEDCIAKNCCKEVVTCAKDPQCQAREACIAQCSSADVVLPSCTDACIADHPYDGVEDGAIYKCATYQCAEECGMGRQLGCVKKYAWPQPAVNTIDWNLTIIDYSQHSPQPNVRVTPCQDVAPSKPCAYDPANSFETNEHGSVTIPLNLLGQFGSDRAAWNGAFAVKAADNAVPGSGADLPDSIFYRSRPEYRTRPPDAAPLPSKANIDIALAYALNKQAPMAGRGTVVGAAFDCRGLINFFASGLTVSVPGADEYVKIAYDNGFNPDPTLGETQPKDGQFIIANVPVGEQAFVLTDAKTGAAFGEAHTWVAADQVTIIAIWPAPQ